MFRIRCAALTLSLLAFSVVHLGKAQDPQVNNEAAKLREQVNSQAAKHQAEVSAQAAKHQTEVSAQAAKHQEEVKSAAAKHQAEVAELQKQLNAARAEVAKLKNTPPPEPEVPPFSVLDLLSETSGMARDAVNYALDQTDMDDRLHAMVTEKVQKAQDVAFEVTAKVLAANYTELLHGSGATEAYKLNIAPHVETLTQAVQPHVDKHVTPAMEKAMDMAAPMLASARESYATATATLHKDYLPLLHEKKEQVIAHAAHGPTYLQKAREAVKSGVDPVFKFLAAVSPRRRWFLPQNPVDRVLFLGMLVVLLYYFVRISYTMMGFMLKLVLTLMRFASPFITVPWRIVTGVLSWWLWLGTCFYCCGMCRSKRKVDALKKQSSNSKSNGNESKDAATLAQVQSLLENAKKENKLPAAAKQLGVLAKSGKTLSNPKDLEGKIITKEILKKALTKYKEVDVKKLDL